MKNKASVILKQVMSLLRYISKAKSLTSIKSKASAIRARLVMFSLMKNKKALLGPISNKIRSILRQQQQHQQRDEELDWDQSKAIVLYDIATASEPQSSSTLQMADRIIDDDRGEASNDNSDGDGGDNDDNDKYPDLRHSLFDEEDDFDDPGGSIIDIVKNSKELRDGKDFRLEDEIDHVADLFITRFHKRMRLQKLESFKRYQQMLARSV